MMSHPQKTGLMKTLCLSLLLLFCAGTNLAQDRCQTISYRQQLLADPSTAIPVLQAEKFSANNLREIPSGRAGAIAQTAPVIIIPVVVHVVYHEDHANISTAQIKSQFEILNKDFRMQSIIAGRIPAAFEALAADTRIEFYLATADPEGRPSSGIIRKKTGIKFFSYDDRIKYASRGGSDAWDAGSYLNIWVGDLAAGLTGYSSPLGGPAEVDGVVIDYRAFGKTNAPRTGQGRTATHEIGHWLGLQHIWGDSYCGDDGIDDTPAQSRATQGCPTGPVSSCSNSGDMYMNFMDFTNDECTMMFTRGQAERMRLSFTPGAARHSLISSAGLNGIGLDDSIGETGDKEPALSVNIFPNPVIGTVNFNFGAQEDLSGQQLMLYNNLGQLLHQATIRKGAVQLDMTRFREGLYFVSVGNKRKLIKLIKR